jgi:DNA-binding SARP family transcriptional activator
LEYRILGSLEVCVDAGPLRLSGHKLRAVLALLLLHRNEIVSADRLIDALWSEEAPAKAANALQSRVSQLRKALGPHARWLETTPSGYVLRLEPGQLDAERFESARMEGGEALARGDLEAAAGVLREGLALWRGDALADFAYEAFAQPEIARLEELRLGAIEDRLEADLGLGAHVQAVGELESLVREHPLRERLRGQLMVALYRCGRQADALSAYQDARAALVDELGIEPSPPLRRLQRAVLEQDRSLDLASVQERDAVAVAPLDEEVAAPGDERKLATVLFADARFTTVGDSDPERVRLRLDRFWQAAIAEVEQLGGAVERFAGAAVTAVFGATVSLEDHAERALHAALALRERLGELFGAGLELRIAVESGEVLVSRPHPGGAVVAGDAVEVAARLAQAGAPGEIVVGVRSAAAAGEAFAVDSASRRLLRALSASRPRGVRGLPQVFVGRETELDMLRLAYRRVAREAVPCLITILGEAGVGKTALVREFSRWLATTSPEPLVRTGRCLPYGRGITYWPLAEIVKEQLGVLDTDAPHVVRKKVGSRTALGLAVGLEPDPGVHPREIPELLHVAWVDWLDDLARQRPVVLVIEDLHWGEPPLLDLVERELRGPLLLIGTARPELLARRPGWGAGARNAAMVRLEPLLPTETTSLIEALLGHEVAASVRGLVLDRAEGNPFFVEELLGTLADRGALTREDGGWVLRDAHAGLQVPDSVQAVLASRIDLLPPLEKTALQVASVIGRVFRERPVRELLDGTCPDFGLLEQRDFVARRPGPAVNGEHEYEIKHTLTREVAYAGLTMPRRARLHAAYAAWLERQGAARDEHAPFLAHHYFEAVRPEAADVAWADREPERRRLAARARMWLRRAADVAVARYAIDEGLDLLRRALDLSADEVEQGELWESIGHASALKYDGEGFWKAMQHALARAPDRRTRARLYSELSYQTALRAGMWKRAPDPKRIEGWIEQALELAPPGSTDRARALVARASWPPHPTAAAREALDLAERLGDIELRSWALQAMAEPARVARDFEQAWCWIRQRLELLPDIADPDNRADATWQATVGLAGVARLDDARQLARQHQEIAAKLTPHHRLHAVAVIAMVEELAGEWARITELEPEIETAVEENSATPCRLGARSLLLCAVALAERGDHHGARRLEHRADETGIEGYGRSLSGLRLRLALSRGNLDVVEQLLDDTVAEHPSLILATTATRLDALAALHCRDRVEAEASPLLQPGTYLEPFALRALALTREDAKLLERAAARFRALDLLTHAERTLAAR